MRWVDVADGGVQNAANLVFRDLSVEVVGQELDHHAQGLHGG